MSDGVTNPVTLWFLNVRLEMILVSNKYFIGYFHRLSRSGFATPTVTFEDFNSVLNVSDGVTNPVTLR